MALCCVGGTIVAHLNVMVPTLLAKAFAAAFIAALVLTVAMYLWPRPTVRLERLVIATFGAVLGGLLGHVWIGASSWVMVMFVSGGAFVPCLLDWVGPWRHRLSRRSPSRS
jgi:hypothetical protein